MSESFTRSERAVQITEMLPGWEVREFGWAAAAHEVNGFDIAQIAFTCGPFNPDNSSLQLPITPIVASRATPTAARHDILQRPIRLDDHEEPLQNLQLNESLRNIWLGMFRGKDGNIAPDVARQFDAGDVPMIDISVFVPFAGQKAALTGTCNNDQKPGKLAVIDGDQLSVIWTNQNPKNGIFDHQNGPLDITPQVSGHAGLFTIVGDYRTDHPTADDIRDESITALIAYGDLPEPPKQLTGGIFDVSGAFEAYNRAAGYPRSRDGFSGGGFGNRGITTLKSLGGGEGPALARRGANAATRITTRQVRADAAMQYPLLLNIIPMTISPQLTDGDRQRILLLGQK